MPSFAVQFVKDALDLSSNLLLRRILVVDRGVEERARRGVRRERGAGGRGISA